MTSASVSFRDMTWFESAVAVVLSHVNAGRRPQRGVVLHCPGDELTDMSKGVFCGNRTVDPVSAVVLDY